MTPKQIEALHRIARVKREVALAELAQLKARDAALVQEDQRLLHEARAQASCAEASVFDARAVAGFARWADLSRAALQDQRAALAPEIEAGRARAAQAVGRSDVLEKLAGRLLQAARKSSGRV